METTTRRTLPHPTPRAAYPDLRLEVQELRTELSTLRRLFDEFAGVYLNARFPYGKPTDRWARRG